MNRRRARRVRAALLWSGFAVAAIATALAVHRLYATVRAEFETQSAQALAQELARLHERVQADTEALRLATMKKLAAFHVEGLGHALREWDEADPAIVGTFQWDAARGFFPGSTPPAALQSGDLPWLRVRERLAREAATIDNEFNFGASGVTRILRTLDNPLLPAAELGYQAENLEILKYAGRVADPWVGWWAHATDPAQPWLFWYQAGPDAAVRGCLVDPQPLVAKLRSAFADPKLARLEFASQPPPSAGASANDQHSRLAPSLPAHTVRAHQGELFVAKQSSLQLTALAVALLLGVFLVAAAILVVVSRRETRDAERKTSFVTQVSHELRTPLTSIQMFADMLGAPHVPNDKRTRFAATISRESQRLTALIERLLQFNALEQKPTRVSAGAIDATGVVRETADAMHAALDAAGLRLETQLPAQPVFANGDPSAVKQALLNLLDNALKYARAGKAVRVRLAADSSLVRITVADDGPGIPPALRDRAFEPFVQGAETLSDQASGVGLGLSLARGMLRRTGGEVVLLPSERGACFEIQLPLASPP